MLQIFLISLREALQAAAIVAPALALPSLRTEGRRAYYLFAGILVSVASGFSLGYISYGDNSFISNGGWTSVRYSFEFLLFYSGLAFMALRPAGKKAAIPIGLFAFGFLVFFFEARALGFLVRDTGLMKSASGISIAASLAGAALGLSMLYPASLLIRKFPIHKALSLPGLLIYAGALKFSLGGVKELEEGSFVITLQRGIESFLEAALGRLESVLMISPHPFMDTPFAGLIAYLKSDRMAMALAVVVLMAPPVYMLIRLFGKADPATGDLQTGADKRLRISFFRKDLLYRAAPALTAFIALVISLHAANLALNPLYEPAPMPVKEEVSGSNVLKILISDQLGDLSDGRLRKYVYYYGDKQIIFIAIMKPDGGVGLALDECEICRPAEWNKAAQGYAQGGGNLLCKYCMTPIAISTINNPGGCNPIPLPFKFEDGYISLGLDDLIRVYKSVQSLEKKGTHL